jgi:hypothetical protein
LVSLRYIFAFIPLFSVLSFYFVFCAKPQRESFGSFWIDLLSSVIDDCLRTTSYLYTRNASTGPYGSGGRQADIGNM